MPSSRSQLTSIDDVNSLSKVDFPEKIVSLAASNTEILFALGVGNRVVGVTSFCDYPEEAKSKTKVGGFLNVDLEKVASLKPDLVLTCAFIQKDVVRELLERDIRVLALNPTSLQDIKDDILLVGRVVGREKSAQDLVSSMNRRMERMALAVRSSGARPPRVYCEEWNRPLILAGDWVAELLELAGAASIFRDRETRVHSKQRVVSPEEVAERDPEVIILSWCGFRDRSNTREALARPGWAATSAARNHRIHALDDRLIMRPGPRIAEGLERLIALIHPHLAELNRKEE